MGQRVHGLRPIGPLFFKCLGFQASSCCRTRSVSHAAKATPNHTQPELQKRREGTRPRQGPGQGLRGEPQEATPTCGGKGSASGVPPATLQIQEVHGQSSSSRTPEPGTALGAPALPRQRRPGAQEGRTSFSHPGASNSDRQSSI